MWPFGKSKNDAQPLSERDVQDILHNLELMARVESAIAGFYRQCAEAAPEDGEFWRQMAASELLPAAHIQRMIVLLGARSEEFRAGREFGPAAIRLLEHQLRTLGEEASLQAPSRRQLLDFARELESSAVELHYGIIVVSSNAEFNRLAAAIDAETALHGEAIAARLAELGAEKAP